MSSMYFKDILIADIDKHTARFVEFQRGLNVVTSTDNHVGKSSLIKSLYHTLGADVKFDNTWSRSTKLTAVRLFVNDIEYRFIRFARKFAILQDDTLIFLTDSVIKGLAPKLEEIFNFSIYLTEKNTAKKTIQAPPSFTFMPYYIDQDIGWKGLYESFLSLEQFEKKERIKSIYFHLGLYTKWTIEKMSERDRLKDDIATLQKREQDIRAILNVLLVETQNLILADDEEELERHLALPKERIVSLVEAAGKVRNRIQELLTTLNQHEYQQNVIKEFTSTTVLDKSDNLSLHTCPRCGYEFDNEIYSLVRKSYNQANEKYLLQQIELIIATIKSELKKQEQEYVRLMIELRKQENAYDESQNAYDIYIRQRGLRETIKKYQIELAENIVAQREKEDEIKEINKTLRKIDGKKEIEASYIDHVKSNLIRLNAWDASFEGRIKLLAPITAQGSLEGKIVLSQYIGLFQTMDEIQSSVIRFPFVVDSPRGNEASVASSQDILNMITGIRMLPQIILATVDYDKYKIIEDVNLIRLTEMRKLLDETTYSERHDEIENLYSLFDKPEK